MSAAAKRRPRPSEYLYAEQYEQTQESRREMTRRLVLEHGRLDLFAEYVMGGDAPMWFHEDMMSFQGSVDEGLILAFRGARKTNYLTIGRALFEIVCNPNIRILFVSDAAEQAKTFLRGVKSHLQRNEELIATFGDLSVNAPKWSDSEITVNRRTSFAVEATVTTAGTDTVLPGRHFDIIICDDMVTEENSVTMGQRQKVQNYFYKTLLPCLEPDGKLWVIGTRWHEEDFYGHLAKEDYKNATYTLGILDEDDKSIWEDRFPTERMHRIRRGNLSAFELQWMCRSGVSLGGIFSEEHFEYYEQLPADYFKWQGVDLAAGQRAQHDFFAHATIAVDKTTRDVYLVEFRETKLPFPRQVTFIGARFDEHPDTVRVGVESNAYQIVMTQQVKETFPDIPVWPVYTQKDKVARAQQLATVATGKPFKVKRQHHKFIRRMCAFPNGPKDVFDAFDIAVTMGLRGVRKRRAREVGLL
jgi:hypothetical protein